MRVRTGIRMMAMLLAAWLLLWPLLFSVALSAHKRNMHRDIKMRVESLLTEDLVLPADEFPDLPGMKELDFRGQRYDLVSVVKHGRVWLVKAVNDTREKALERGLKKRAGKGTSLLSFLWLKCDTPRGGHLFAEPVGSAVVIGLQASAALPPGHIKLALPPPENQWYLKP